LGGKKASEHFIVAANREAAYLQQFAEKNGIMLPSLAQGISGPFSALSAAGLLPLAAAGLNTDEILRGAAQMDSLCMRDNARKNPAVMAAAFSYGVLKSRRAAGLKFWAQCARLESLAGWCAVLFESAGGAGIKTGSGCLSSGSKGGVFSAGEYLSVFIDAGHYGNSPQLPAAKGAADTVKLSDMLKKRSRQAQDAAASEQRPFYKVTLPEF